MAQTERETLRKIGAFLLVLFSVVLMLPLPGAGQQPRPAAIIERFNETLLKAMKGGDRLGYQGRYELLAPVVKDSFALGQKARISLGKHWEALSAAERKQYLETYLDWTTATYAGAVALYLSSHPSSGADTSLVRGSGLHATHCLISARVGE